MNLALGRFFSAREFLSRTEAYLVEHEAEHNLILGLATRIAGAGETDEARPPYLACVEQEGRVVAAALMTPPHDLVLSRVDGPLDQVLNLIITDLLADDGCGDWPVLGVSASKEVSRRFTQVWESRTGVSATLAMSLRIYSVSAMELVRPAGAAGRMRSATIADRPLLVQWTREFTREATRDPDRPGDAERVVDGRLSAGSVGMGAGEGAATGTGMGAGPGAAAGGMVLWEAGDPPCPVAMAGYTGPTPHGIRIGPVYTPPPFRCRGYASALVAALSQRLLESGRRFCYLFTDLSNPTSNQIYQAIGYQPVDGGDADQYRFEPEIRPLRSEDAVPISEAFAAIGWTKPASQYALYVAEQSAGVRSCWVAAVGGKFAGYVTLNWYPTYPGVAGRGIPEIQDLNVLPAFRRRGIGSRLLDRAEAVAAARGYPYIAIGVGLHPGYNAAQRLYVQRGYVPDGRGITCGDRFPAEGESVRLDDSLALHLEKKLDLGWTRPGREQER